MTFVDHSTSAGDGARETHQTRGLGDGERGWTSAGEPAASQGEDGVFATFGAHHAAVRYLSWSSALLLSQLYALEQASLYRKEVDGVSTEGEWQQWARWHTNVGETTVPATLNSMFTHRRTASGHVSPPAPRAAPVSAPPTNAAGGSASATAAAASCAKALAFILIYVHESPIVPADASASPSPSPSQTSAAPASPSTLAYNSITEAFEALYYPSALLASVTPLMSADKPRHGTRSHGRAGRADATTNDPISSNSGTNHHTAIHEDLPLPSEVHDAFSLFLRLAQQCVLPALQVLLVRRRRRLDATAGARRGNDGVDGGGGGGEGHWQSDRREHSASPVHTHGFGQDDNGAPLFLDELSGEQAASCVLQLTLGLAFSCPCTPLAAAAQLVLAEALARLGQDGFHVHSLHGFLRGLPVLVRTSAGTEDTTAKPSTGSGTRSPAAVTATSALRALPASLPPLPHATSTGTVADGTDWPAGTELDDTYLVASEAVIRQELDRLHALTPPSAAAAGPKAATVAENKPVVAVAAPATAATAATAIRAIPATLHMRPDVDEVVWVDARGGVHVQSMHAWLNDRRTAAPAVPAQVRTRALCAPLPATTALSTIQRLVLPSVARDVSSALHLQAALDEAVETSRSAHHNAVRRAIAVPGATKAQRRKKMALSSGLDSSGSPVGESPDLAPAPLPRRQQLLRVLAQGHLFLTRPMRLSANEMLFQTFADGGECPGYYHLLALQPEVLKAHRDTTRHLFTGEGPLPIDLRLMLAVMIASRHRCEYLVARYGALLMRYAAMELQPQYEAPAALSSVGLTTPTDATGSAVGGGAGPSAGLGAGMAGTGAATNMGPESANNMNNMNNNNNNNNNNNANSSSAAATGKSGDAQVSPAQQAPSLSVYDDVDDDVDAVQYLQFDDDTHMRGAVAGRPSGSSAGTGTGHAAAAAATSTPRSGSVGHSGVSGAAAANGSRHMSAVAHVRAPSTDDMHDMHGMRQRPFSSDAMEAEANVLESAAAAPVSVSARSTACAAPSAVKVKERWLTQGPPARLQAAQHLIAIAAHTPWLVQESDVRALLRVGWTVPELFQLMAIITHVLPLCSFVMGLYVTSEPWVSTVLPLSVSRRLQHSTVANDNNSHNNNNNNNDSANGEDSWAAGGESATATVSSRRVPVARAGPASRHGPAHGRHGAANEDRQSDSSDSTETDDEEEAAHGSAADHQRDLYALYAGEEAIVSEQRIKGTATNHHALWRSQFNWLELGTTFMEQYYPGAAGLLNAEMDAVLDLSRRLSEVDCVGLKTGNYTPEYALRSLQLYVCNLLGYMTEDYPYNDINKVLRRPAKWFAQVLTVRPEVLTRDDVVRWHGALATPSSSAAAGPGGVGAGSRMTATSTSNNQSTIANTQGPAASAAAAVSVAASGAAVSATLTHSLRRENELLAGAVHRASTTPRELGLARNGASTLSAGRLAHAAGSSSAKGRVHATSASGRREAGLSSPSTTTGRGLVGSASEKPASAGGTEDGPDVPHHLEEAALVQAALSIQDERVLWLTALATMEARREGLLHILMHPLCSVVQNL